MAINKIQGNILADNLQRGANLTVQGNLLFIDVTNTRIGVNTSSTSHTLTVNGNSLVSGNFTVSGQANTASLNVTGVGNLGAIGNVIITGGSVGQFVQTNGSGNLSFATVSLSNISNGTSNVSIPVANGNVNTSVGGNANVLVVSASGANITGTLNATGNADLGNLDVTNVIATTLSSTGNVTGGNVNTAGLISATGNVTGGNVITSGSVSATGNVTGGNLFTAGAVSSGSLIVSGLSNLANITISNTTISSNLANASITVQPIGNGLFNIDTTTGMILPAGNTIQRPSSPPTGTVRFNTTTSLVEVWQGSQWETVGNVPGSITNQYLYGDNSTATFTLNESTTASAIIVSTNGVVQFPTIAYTVSGNQITFAEAPLSTDVIDVRFTSTVITISSISNGLGQELVITTPGVTDISSTHSLKLPEYTVLQANALANTANGQLIYVSNGDSGNPCLAVYSNSAWKRVSLGANISSV